jgi:hypothetical protein
METEELRYRLLPLTRANDRVAAYNVSKSL